MGEVMCLSLKHSCSAATRGCAVEKSRRDMGLKNNSHRQCRLRLMFTPDTRESRDTVHVLYKCGWDHAKSSQNALTNTIYQLYKVGLSEKLQPTEPIDVKN